MTSTSEISSFRMAPPPAAFYEQEGPMSQSNYAALLQTLCINKRIIQAVNLKWVDIPIEREARVISKRAAEYLFGEEAVRKYIDEKIAGRISEDDKADWQFVRTLSPSSAVNLVTGTQILFQRLRDYRAELQKVLQHAKNDDSDFADVDLDSFFNTSQN